MYNILIIITISLFIISCSDSNDADNAISKPTVKESETNVEKTAPSEVIQTATSEVIQEESDTKWDKIVGSQETDGTVSNSEQKANSSFDKISYTPTFFVSKNDIMLGNAKAKIVLVEYFSPTCPHCSYYNRVIFPQIKKKYVDTNKIAYVVREFIGNKQDLDAAILGRCSNDKESFFKFQSIILEQQDKWSGNHKYRDLLTNMGQIGGISPEAYAKCLNNNEIIETLLSNTNLAGRAKGFVGTPAFFINGVQLKEGYSVESLSKFIDLALEKNNTE
jgi:protein-disulfide isomerase